MARIQQTKAQVCVIGVGYVGLPLAVKLAELGYLVIGVDKDEAVVSSLNCGQSHIEGVTTERVRGAAENGRLKFLSSSDSETVMQLTGVDIFVICVHTPLKTARGWEPETCWIEKAICFIRTIYGVQDAADCPTERLIVLESTTYPGTTHELLVPLADDFKSCVKTFVAYSPERANPGVQPEIEVNTPGGDPFSITRIVGGFDDASVEHARAFYKSAYDTIHVVGGLEAAEMTKLIENTFRFVSIAFANEMMRVTKLFDLNIWEIIEAAKTKGFGLDLCYPGLIGGHCIPIDPHYLSWAVRTHRRRATLIDVSESSHQATLGEACDLVLRSLSHNGHSICESSILLCGLAYKENIADIRESASLELIKQLIKYSVDITVWDPLCKYHPLTDGIPVLFSKEEYESLPERITKLMTFVQQKGEKRKEREEQRSLNVRKLDGRCWTEVRGDVLGDRFQCIVIATNHDVYHEMYQECLEKETSPPIVDLHAALYRWLSTASLAQDQQIAARAKLAALSGNKRYMLLGVH